MFNSKMKNTFFLMVSLIYIMSFVNSDKEHFDSYYSQSENEVHSEQIKIIKGIE